MSIEKLKQMGTLDEKSTYTTSLGFVRAINNNADELGTTKKLDLRTKNTPKHIAQALKEQAKNKISYKTMGGPDDLPDYEQGPTNSPSSLKDGLAQIYNKELAEQPEPEPITALNIDVVEGLQEGEENVAPHSLIANLSTEGGTSPYTYSFYTDPETGKDNNDFVIEGDKLKLGENTIAAGSYKVAIQVTDKNNESFFNSTTITILPATPDITLLNFDVASGLQEGNDNVKPGAAVVTLSTKGGTAPFTYSFNPDSSGGKDNGLFTIEGDKIKVGTTALTAGNFKISVKVTDTNSKTFINATVITVTEAAKPEITNLNINIVDGLQEGNENVAANAVIGTLSATGGTSPYTYTLGSNTTGKNNSSFVVEEDKVKVGTTALTAGNYIISIIATDKNKKTLEEVANFTVDAASTDA